MPPSAAHKTLVQPTQAPVSMVSTGKPTEALVATSPKPPVPGDVVSSATAAPGDAVAFIDVTMDDFLAFPAVVDWLRLSRMEIIALVEAVEPLQEVTSADRLGSLLSVNARLSQTHIA